MLLHKLHLPLVRLAQILILLGCANVRLASWEPVAGVVMNGIHRVRQNFLEGCKVHGIRVSIQKKNVVRVDFANGLFHSLVPRLEVDMVRVCWLVHGIVPSDLRAFSICDTPTESKHVREGLTQVFPR